MQTHEEIIVEMSKFDEKRKKITSENYNIHKYEAYVNIVNTI